SDSTARYRARTPSRKRPARACASAWRHHTAAGCSCGSGPACSGSSGACPVSRFTLGPLAPRRAEKNITPAAASTATHPPTPPPRPPPPPPPPAPPPPGGGGPPPLLQVLVVAPHVALLPPPPPAPLPRPAARRAPAGHRVAPQQPLELVARQPRRRLPL